MNNFYYDLDVEGALQCPVCFELPPKDIFLCKVGHHMCDKCRKRLTSCPTCQSALTSARNYLAETLITKFSIFKGSGDVPDNNNVNSPIPAARTQISQSLLQTTGVPQKAVLLDTGMYKCLLESCPNRKEIGVGHMFRHLDSTHAHIYDKFKNTLSVFTHKFENFWTMNGKHKYHRAFHVSNLGLFFLNMELTEDRYINCWLSIPASIKKSKLFSYEMELSKENGDEKIVFADTVASNLQTMEWLLSRGRVFIVPPTRHKLNDGEFFSLQITIAYKAPTTTHDSPVPDSTQ